MNTEKFDETEQDAAPKPPSKKRKRFQFKKLLFVLFILTFLTAAIGASTFFYLSYSNKFPIKTVSVVGVYQYVKENDIQTTLEPYITNKGLFAFSEWRAQKALEQVPGVAHVSIYRIFPSEIKVIITEYIAKARFADGTLLSEDGTVFRALNPASDNSNLPLLNGDPHYRKEMMEMLVSVKPIFANINQNVSGLGLSTNGDWSVQLNNQTWIMLGKQQLQKHVLDFLTVYPLLMKTASTGASLSYVDLRYHNGFSVIWKGASPPAKALAKASGS